MAVPRCFRLLRSQVLRGRRPHLSPLQLVLHLYLVAVEAATFGRSHHYMWWRRLRGAVAAPRSVDREVWWTRGVDRAVFSLLLLPPLLLLEVMAHRHLARVRLEASVL